MTLDEQKPATTDEPDRPFTKVYPEGWKRIETMLSLTGGKVVSKLWLLLVQHCDRHNAVVASLDTLADALGFHPVTISKAATALKKQGAISIFKTGTGNVYVLNPEETWKNTKRHKSFCSFGATVLLGYRENTTIEATLKAREPQPELDI